MKTKDVKCEVKIDDIYEMYDCLRRVRPTNELMIDRFNNVLCLLRDIIKNNENLPNEN